MKARKAKQTKRHTAKAAAAKRTKIGQSLKKYGVSFEVETEGMTISRANQFVSGGLPISPRGREMVKGITNPFAKPPKDMPQSVQDYFLSSKAIRRYAYDQNNMTLEIIFQTGYGYHFFNVPYSVWINFQMAQSKGRFFMNHIYGYWSGKKGSKIYHPNYKYKRIQ